MKMTNREINHIFHKHIKRGFHYPYKNDLKYKKEIINMKLKKSQVEHYVSIFRKEQVNLYWLSELKSDRDYLWFFAFLVKNRKQIGKNNIYGAIKKTESLESAVCFLFDNYNGLEYTLSRSLDIFLEKHYCCMFQISHTKLAFLEPTNEQQMLWAWEYLNKKGLANEFIQLFSVSTKYYDKIIFILDYHCYSKRVAVNDLIVPMGKAWWAKKQRNKSQKSKRSFNITINQDAYNKLSRHASINHLSKNQLIEQLIENISSEKRIL